MQTALITPSNISRAVATHPVAMPAYNWTEQSRYDGAIMMSSTMNTKQTFNAHGTACDQTSDQD